jgi:hypothetical protein
VPGFSILAFCGPTMRGDAVWGTLTTRAHWLPSIVGVHSYSIAVEGALHCTPTREHVANTFPSERKWTDFGQSDSPARFFAALGAESSATSMLRTGARCATSTHSLAHTSLPHTSKVIAHNLVPCVHKPWLCARSRHALAASQSMPSHQAVAASRRGMMLLFGGGMGAGIFRAPVATAATTKTAVEKVLDDPKWPERFPFREDDFLRYDESPDTQFYESPRFVFHIDEPAIKSLTKCAPRPGASCFRPGRHVGPAR